MLTASIHSLRPGQSWTHSPDLIDKGTTVRVVSSLSTRTFNNTFISLNFKPRWKRKSNTHTHTHTVNTNKVCLLLCPQIGRSLVNQTSWPSRSLTSWSIPFFFLMTGNGLEWTKKMVQYDFQLDFYDFKFALTELKYVWHELKGYRSFSMA